MRCVASLYDNLADAVDEINSIFSKVVRSNKLKAFVHFANFCMENSNSLQMIVVFIPALTLTIFALYFVIKSTVLNLPIRFYVYVDFLSWNFFLVGPALAAIYIGAVTTKQGQNLRNHIGKYSNGCNDHTLSRVCTFAV